MKKQFYETHQKNMIDEIIQLVLWIKTYGHVTWFIKETQLKILYILKGGDF